MIREFVFVKDSFEKLRIPLSNCWKITGFLIIALKIKGFLKNFIENHRLPQTLHCRSKGLLRNFIATSKVYSRNPLEKEDFLQKFIQ